jgi:hypothetical protein
MASAAKATASGWPGEHRLGCVTPARPRRLGERCSGAPRSPRTAALGRGATTPSVWPGSCPSGPRSPIADVGSRATSRRRRTGISLVCAALFLLGLANPIVAQAQTNSSERGPSELWRTYPLEPREGEARIRSANEPDQPQASRPGSGDAPAVREGGRLEGQPSGNRDRQEASPALSLFVLSLVGLIVVVLVARPAMAVGRHVPGSLARFGSALTSPVRSVPAPPRSKFVGSAFRPTAGRAGRRHDRETTVSRRALGRPVLRAGAAAGAGLGRTGARAVRLLVRVGATVGAGLRSATVGIVSKRREILLYALVVVASVAVGIALAVFLSSG